MDNRETLGQNETFLKILSECLESGKQADMIVDENGLDRLSGVVVSIERGKDGDIIVLEGGRKVALGAIVAVNGVFSAPYEGC